MLIGYARGGTDEADALAARRRSLRDAGCERVVEEDLASGLQREQPELRRMLDGLQAGDVVVVPQLDGLGRSLPEVARCVHRINAAGASLRSLKEGLDTATAQGRAASGVIDSLAGLDRGGAPDRFGAEPGAARTEGRRRGRRPKLTGQQRALIAEEVLSGRETAARMARRHKVSEATVSRAMAAHRAMADAPEGGRSCAEDTGQGGKVAGLLPLSVLDQRLAIVGTSGSGKTYAAKGLVERLMGQGARVCVVDPLGVWWGLRAGADGAASPSPDPVVVFGGHPADVALDTAWVPPSATSSARTAWLAWWTCRTWAAPPPGAGS